MDRLTERDEYGNTDIIGVDSADLQLSLEFDEFNRVTSALNRLAELEDAEEQRNKGCEANVKQLKEAAEHIIFAWDNCYIEPYSADVKDYIEQMRLALKENT